VKATTAFGAFVLAVVFAAGDRQPSLDAELACEAAREIVRLQSSPAPAPPKPNPGKCVRCNGTGKVKSGDGIAVIPCPDCDGGKK
jgi:hypothetical protein